MSESLGIGGNAVESIVIVSLCLTESSEGRLPRITLEEVDAALHRKHDCFILPQTHFCSPTFNFQPQLPLTPTLLTELRDLGEGKVRKVLSA